MLIESILRRPGGSKVDIDGITYHFQPDADGRHVAEVDARTHISRLLAIPEGYRLPETAGEETQDAEASAPQDPQGEATAIVSPRRARPRPRKSEGEA